jgi:hypothetical protein
VRSKSREGVPALELMPAFPRQPDAWINAKRKLEPTLGRLHPQPLGLPRRTQGSVPCRNQCLCVTAILHGVSRAPLPATRSHAGTLGNVVISAGEFAMLLLCNTKAKHSEEVNRCKRAKPSSA